MGHGPRRRHRDRSPGAGACACRPRTSLARIARSSTGRRSCSKATDVADVDLPAVAVLRRRASRAGDDLRAWRDGQLRLQDETDPRRPPAGATSRSWARPAGCDTPCRGHTAASSSARCPLAVPRPRDARLPLRPGGVRVRHAGTRVGADLAVRHRRAQAALPAARRRRARRSRPSRSRRPTPAPTSRRCRPRLAATAASIVIDGEKTWISNAGIAGFYVVFCRWPEGGERSFVAVRRRCRHPGLTIGPMIDVMAPHPLGTLTFTDVPRTRRPDRRRARQGHARRARHARRLPRHGRRRGARVRPPRPRRGRRARAEPRRLRQAARRLPADAGEARRHGRGHRRRGAAGVSRCLDRAIRARRG